MSELKELWHILYHGTKKENVESILKDGFKPYTYFAKNLAEAIHYGDKYVFAVVVPHSLAPDWFDNCLCWQIMNKVHEPSSKIVGLKKYEVEVLFENKKLLEEVFKRSLPYHERGYL